MTDLANEWTEDGEEITEESFMSCMKLKKGTSIIVISTILCYARIAKNYLYPHEIDSERDLMRIAERKLSAQE